MLIDGMTLVGEREARMNGLEFVLLVEAYGGLAETHVKGLAHQAPRRGVATRVHLQVAVAVQLGADPAGTLRLAAGQGVKHRPLGLDKTLQRWRTCGAVDAVTRLLHDPDHQLLVGVGKIAELAQRQEFVLDVLDARFHPPFLLRIRHRAGGNEEPVALGINTRLIGSGR